MDFIEVDKSKKETAWNMYNLHSHSHYEIYFLMEGIRNFFLSNTFYVVKAPSVVIIPPSVMHKTEGGPFMRYNVNVAKDYLDDFQLKVLSRKEVKVMPVGSKEKELLSCVLEDMLALDNSSKEYRYKMKTMFAYLVCKLDKLKNDCREPNVLTRSDVPPLILEIIYYLQLHCNEKITLSFLAEQFHVSKGSLVYNFKKHTAHNPIDFLLHLRIIKAKELLKNTNFSMQKISEECGFSSANYFGLIFKSKEGIAPQNYRKLQRSKI